jgi:hypothetical protein
VLEQDVAVVWSQPSGCPGEGARVQPMGVADDAAFGGQARILFAAFLSAQAELSVQGVAARAHTPTRRLTGSWASSWRRGCWLAVDRGRRHAAQPCRYRVVKFQLTKGPQPAHHLRQERRHPLTRRASITAHTVRNATITSSS